MPVPDIFKHATMVGYSNQKVDTNSYSLQTMFRLNVGGKSVLPSNYTNQMKPCTLHL